MRQAEVVMQSGNWMQELFEELKRRRVIRVATLYIIAFWPIIQIVDILSPTLNLPDSVIRYLVFAFIGGFPVMLILAWVFDINREGISVTAKDGVIEPSALSRERSPIIGGRSELLVVAVLVVLVIGLFVVQSRMEQEVEILTSVPATTPGTEALAVDTHSIAVLPFVSFSEANRDQLFADGLTEELLTVLSRVKELRVVARTSSFAYRGVNKNVIDIGRELNVAVILEGSVRRNDIDDTIRVTAQLIETKKGRHMWSKTYDRQYRDIFKIQDDISASVVKELEITMLGEDRKKLLSRSSASPEAMVAYGIGQAELSRRTEVSLKDAARFFQKAITEDENYSDAYAGLATAYALMVNYGYAPKEQYLILSQEAIDRSLSLDPASGIAFAAQGLIHMENMQSEQAMSALEKAMTLNPSYAMAPMWYAGLIENQTERLSWYEKAYELDPKSPVVGFNIANIMLEQGRDVEAMQVFVKIVEADPYYPGAYHLVARINEQRGRLDEALQHYKRAFELQPNIKYSSGIANLYVDMGEFESAQKWIEIVSEEAPDFLAERVDWLRIQSFTSAGLFEEARPLLIKKVESARGNESSLDANLDAAWAAYLIEDRDKDVIAAFEKAEVLLSSKEHDVMFGRDFYLEAALAAAYAYKSVGDEKNKLELLGRINVGFKDMLAEGGRIKPESWYQMALLSAIEDNDQMVLVNLQRAIDEGWRQPWRPPVEPILKELIAGKNFQSMLAGLETRMSIMREQLTLAASFESDWPG